MACYKSVLHPYILDVFKQLLILVAFEHQCQLIVEDLEFFKLVFLVSAHLDMLIFLLDPGLQCGDLVSKPSLLHCRIRLCQRVLQLRDLVVGSFEKVLVELFCSASFLDVEQLRDVFAGLHLLSRG